MSSRKIIRGELRLFGIFRIAKRNKHSEAIDAFGWKVLQIKGDWLDIVGIDTNFKQFQDGVAKGMTPAQAALSTWTGKNAARRGFGALKSVVEGPGWVQVLFGKG